MIALPTAKNFLRDAHSSLIRFHQEGGRLTDKEYRDAEIQIAECRNLLNCIEEQLPNVRP
jgi:hypothetical protein